MYRYVIMAPGQGAQWAGMLDPWLAESARARDLVTEWSQAAGFDLAAASRDESALGDTAVAQPALTACALLALDELRRRIPLGEREVLFAGHSVGEIAAAVGAGYLTPAAGVALARARGAAMSGACANGATGMAAVMPAKRDPASDDAICAAITAVGLEVANWNGSHQFVAAGPLDRLQDFAEAGHPGLRIAPLDVAGAFHSQAMTTATSPFARAAAQAGFKSAASPMVGNADGTLIASPDDLRRRLITQLTSAVRWDLCMAAVAELVGPGALYVELAPAGPLTKLAERAHPGIRAIALRAPRDVGRLGELTVAGSTGGQDRLSGARGNVHPASPAGLRPGRGGVPGPVGGRGPGRGPLR